MFYVLSRCRRLFTAARHKTDIFRYMLLFFLAVRGCAHGMVYAEAVAAWRPAASSSFLSHACSFCCRHDARLPAGLVEPDLPSFFCSPSFLIFSSSSFLGTTIIFSSLLFHSPVFFFHFLYSNVYCYSPLKRVSLDIVVVFFLQPC